jgi:hypothetical protein
VSGDDTRLLERMLPAGANPADYVIGSSSGLPRPKLQDVKDADAYTLLDQLAVVADRAAKLGGALPPDMAEKMDALADAARRQGPVITHPAWCDRVHCFSEPEPDGTISVGHLRVLLEEFDCDVHVPGMRPEARVQVIRYDNYYPDGSVDSEGAVMFVDVPQHNEFMGPAAHRFARAVAVAGELIAGDHLPPGCKLSRPAHGDAHPG